MAVWYNKHDNVSGTVTGKKRRLSWTMYLPVLSFRNFGFPNTTMRNIRIQDFTPEQIYGSGLRPDANFSYEHNMRVLEETSKENYQRQYKLSEKVAKAAGDVADILAHYAKATLDRGEHKSIEQYLGREMAKKLFGDRLNAKLTLSQRTELQIKRQKEQSRATFFIPGSN